MAPIKEKDKNAAIRARLANSLSASYPSQALSQAFQNIEQDDSDSEQDPLSSSCFAEMRLEKVKMEDLVDSDDELTSLTWLHETNLLQNIRVDSCTSPTDREEQNGNDVILQNNGIYGVPHPPHVPYNPQKHINSKPPYSFSCLIFMSVEDSPEKKLPVKDIYNWILTHFPYFQNAPTGWKNSVRHNLSLNKCFKKVEKDRCSNIGKGSLWMIDPDFRPNLLQALRKTPYHPYHQLQMFNNSQNTTTYGLIPGSEQKSLQARFNVNSPSPHLFPFLSRRLAQSGYDTITTTGSSMTVSDIDVANTLVSLKRASENRILFSNDTQETRSPSPPEFGSDREKELLQQKKIRASTSDYPIVYYAIPGDDHSYCISEHHTPLHNSVGSITDEECELRNYDRHVSDVEEDTVFSESDYEEEGWSEEEELYHKEKLKFSSLNKFKRSSIISDKLQHLNYHKSKKINQSILSPAISDEDMKVAEGANALLNLAGIKTAHIVPLRSISPSNSINNNNHLKKDQSSSDGDFSNSEKDSLFIKSAVMPSAEVELSWIKPSHNITLIKTPKEEKMET